MMSSSQPPLLPLNKTLLDMKQFGPRRRGLAVHVYEKLFPSKVFGAIMKETQPTKPVVDFPFGRPPGRKP